MDISAFAAQYQLWWIIGAIMLLGLVFLVRGISKKTRTVMTGLGVFCVAMLVLGFMNVPTGGGGGGGGGGEDGCTDDNPTTPCVEWSITLTTTYPGAADIDDEMLDTQSFTACDAGTPDLDATMGTFGTNAFIDEAASKVSYMSDMDNDVPPGGAMQEIECLTVAWTISLKGNVDANGDGVNDAIPHGFKLLEITPVTFDDWNRTTSMPTVYRDSDAGWEIAGYTSGAEWYSAFDASGKFAGTMPSSGPWVMTDTHAGGGAAADTGVFAIALNTPNGAPAGYLDPSGNANVICLTFKIAIGSPANYRVISGEWVMLTRD